MKGKSIPAGRTDHDDEPPRAGWRVVPWCDAVSISRGVFYSLPETAQPRSVLIRGMRIVVEAPSEWLRRVGQAVPTRISHRSPVDAAGAKKVAGLVTAKRAKAQTKQSLAPELRGRPSGRLGRPSRRRAARA